MIYGDMLTARAHLFRALGDRIRLEILEHLRAESPLTVSQICERLGREQNLISHHLSCLKNCGLVNSEKNGKNVHYSIKSKKILKITDLADEHVRGILEDVISCTVVKDIKQIKPKTGEGL